MDRPCGGLQVPVSCLQIQESDIPGAGLGLFSAQDFPKGTILGEYPGDVLPSAQHEASTKMKQATVEPEAETYIWRFGDNQFVIGPTYSQGILQDLSKGGNPSTPLSVGFLCLFMACATASLDAASVLEEATDTLSVAIFLFAALAPGVLEEYFLAQLESY